MMWNDIKTQVKSLMLIHGRKRSKWDPRPIIFFFPGDRKVTETTAIIRVFSDRSRRDIYHWREQRAFSAPVSISAEVRGRTRDSVENASRENISGSLSSFSSLCFPPEYVYMRRINERILRRARAPIRYASPQCQYFVVCAHRTSRRALYSVGNCAEFQPRWNAPSRRGCEQECT